MSTLQILCLLGGAATLAALLAYLAAWAVIGHEPLVARNCNCRRRR